MREAATLNFRAAQADLYRAAASLSGLRLSDWLRAAADDALKAQGFSTGSPETQYALVSSGNLVKSPRCELVTTFKPHPVTPASPFEGCPADAMWLPIENRDSQPFDAALHYRLKPLPLRVDGDVVVREYPVVLKAEGV